MFLLITTERINTTLAQQMDGKYNDLVYTGMSIYQHDTGIYWYTTLYSYWYILILVYTTGPFY